MLKKISLSDLEEGNFFLNWD